MQTPIQTLLRKIGQVTMHIAAMQNQAVSYYFACQLKNTAGFSSVNFMDLAYSAERYVKDSADDFCKEDVTRLKSMASLFRQTDSALQDVLDESLRDYESDF